MISADLQNVQVWLATTPVDMRKSFDGLAEVVRSFLGHDPLSGHLFVFRNRSRPPREDFVVGPRRPNARDTDRTQPHRQNLRLR